MPDHSVSNQAREAESVREIALQADSWQAAATFLEKLPALVWRSDAEGWCDYFNQAWLQFTGRTLEQLQGHGWGAGVHPDDCECCFTMWQQAVQEERGFEVEYRLRRHDGQWRWMVDIGNPLRAPDGSVQGFIGLCYDITERVGAQEQAQRAQERLAEAQRVACLGSWELDVAEDVVSWSTEMFRHYGLPQTPTRMSKADVLSCVHPDDLPMLAYEAHQAEGKADFEWKYRVVRPDGDVRFLHARGQYLYDAQGQLQKVIGTESDITEFHATQQALQRSEERYALAARGANDGLWDWDFTADCIYYSPRWKEMLGFAESEIKDNPDEWLSRVHPDDLPGVRAQLDRHLSGKAPQFHAEHRVRHKDGSHRWMLWRGLAVCGKGPSANESGFCRMAGSQTDVTERRVAEEQLLHNAFHDALTNLPNRALFTDRLEHALRGVRRREKAMLAVLFLDFDRFKRVNDTLGHEYGDLLLIGIASRLLECLRSNDSVARLGGDEFTVLFDDIHRIEQVTEAAERIQKSMNQPFDLRGHEVEISASIGIAATQTGDERPGDLLRDADAAMYRAKAMGRDRYEIFDDTMHEQVRCRLQLESDLKRALERGEFQVHYQPIFDLRSGRLTGFESLLRWQHPQRGSVAPAEFLGLAEETGLIVPLDMWVLRQSCEQMRHWMEMDGHAAREAAQGEPLSISVNVSSRHFANRDLIEGARRALAETSLDPSHLRLEMTEGALESEAAAPILAELRALGIRLSMDNWGLGSSSLSHLHRFPIHALKIDRSFIASIGPTDKVQGDESEIVRAILALARALGVEVVAEGIETPEQLAHLRALDCRYGQGYFFSKPVAHGATKAIILGGPDAGHMKARRI